MKTERTSAGISSLKLPASPRRTKERELGHCGFSQPVFSSFSRIFENELFRLTVSKSSVDLWMPANSQTRRSSLTGFSRRSSYRTVKISAPNGLERQALTCSCHFDGDKCRPVRTISEKST